jgi:hypothetical protein
MQAHDTGVFDDSYFAPSYNVVPQSLQPVVRLDGETGERELTIMRWVWCRSGLRMARHHSARSTHAPKRLRLVRLSERH